MKLNETQKNFRKQMEQYKKEEKMNNDHYSKCCNAPSSRDSQSKKSFTLTVVLVIGLIFIIKFTIDTQYLSSSAPVETNANQDVNEITQEHSMNPTTEEQTAKYAAENVSDEMADYYSQFSWYNSEFGIVNDSATSNYGIISIKGRAIPFEKSYSYVEITYGIYSMNGNKTGTAYTNITNLSEGTTWQFEAIGMASGSDGFKYKLESISGW